MEICNYIVFGLLKNEEATVYAQEEFSKFVEYTASLNALLFELVNAKKQINCGKNFFNKLDAKRERACMETLKERYDIEVTKYQQTCIAESKRKYFT